MKKKAGGNKFYSARGSKNPSQDILAVLNFFSIFHGVFFFSSLQTANDKEKRERDIARGTYYIQISTFSTGERRSKGEKVALLYTKAYPGILLQERKVLRKLEKYVRSHLHM